MAISFYPRPIEEVPPERHADCRRLALIAFHHGILADPIELNDARWRAFGSEELGEDDEKIWEAIKGYLINT
jgi:hypothetical protein